VLVVDDNETMCSGVVLVLEKMGLEAVGVFSGAEALSALEGQAFDLVITDYRMDGMDGIGLLEAVREKYTDIDVVLITAYGTIEIAVEAIKKGAADFITKPFPPEALQVKVEKVLEHRSVRHDRERLGEENRYLREEIGEHYNFGEMVGSSPEMQSIFKMVSKVASTDSAVLIYGESGTGKELVARAVHNQSSRNDRPFVKVNCGALPRELVESELFGHEKGAFTGAIRQKKGKFELAEGGTIFLDEIGDLPLDAQINILRVLQEKEYDRVGGEKTLHADVRVIAATHRNLEEMVADGTFREDLFYRLEVIPLRLSALRDRKVDIPALVEHFLHKKCQELNRKAKRFTPRALDALVAYGWPGNVRELENVIERTIVLSDRDEVDINDLPLGTEAVAEPTREPHNSEMRLTGKLEALERSLIEDALGQAEGVKSHAAEILGVKTSALYYKLDKYGLA
jgi:two-component system response regulator HydG